VIRAAEAPRSAFCDSGQLVGDNDCDELPADCTPREQPHFTIQFRKIYRGRSASPVSPECALGIEANTYSRISKFNSAEYNITDRTRPEKIAEPSVALPGLIGIENTRQIRHYLTIIRVMRPLWTAIRIEY